VGAACKETGEGLGVRMLRSKLSAEHLIGMAKELNCPSSVALLKNYKSKIHLRLDFGHF
jgi:hypothetical protein